MDSADSLELAPTPRRNQNGRRFMTLSQQIEFFFAPPYPEQPGTVRSPLHLARREAQECILGDVIPDEANVLADERRHRLFATTMVMISAIDLLAKFYAGTDKGGRGASEDRFRRFSMRYIFAGLPDAQLFARVLWEGCRNPLHHSFTLYSSRYEIRLYIGPPPGIVSRVAGRKKAFLISVEGLYGSFISATKAYETDLRSTPDLQAKFQLMFPSYGSLTFRRTP